MRKRYGLAIFAVVLLAVFAVACGDDSDSAATESSATEAVTAATAAMAEMASRGTSPDGSPSGIWATGQSSIALEPDLAILDIGVESLEKTVAEARVEAAQAMDAMLAVLANWGVEDKDIQTRSLTIRPQYDYMEVVKEGVRTSEQVLTGYRVRNTASVKLRNLDDVGPIIDEVAGAGGDSTRIDGIRFTVEETEPFEDQLRQEAVADAQAKAQRFAELTGVSLGDLVFITEIGGGVPVVGGFTEDSGLRMALAAQPAATSVSGGELELQMAVQAVFAIR